MKIYFLTLLTVLLIPYTLFAQGEGSADRAQGERLFMEDKPQEALPFLESAVNADPLNVDAALYLAMCYEQLDMPEEAAAVYRRILPIGGEKSALIACNLGNVYFKIGNNVLAEQFYTQAIRGDPAYAPALLNRANTRVRNGSLRDALADYQRYLGLEPDTPQRSQIQRLIGLIEENFAAEAIRRLMVEESSRAETERRQRLLSETLEQAMPEHAESALPEQEAAGEALDADPNDEEPDNEEFVTEEVDNEEPDNVELYNEAFDTEESEERLEEEEE